MPKLSTSPILRYISNFFAIIAIGFGINALLNPASALSFFELEYPTSGPAKRIVDVLLVVYGIRDIFMGLAIFAAGWRGGNRVLGLIVLGMSFVAFGDGYACFVNGKGEWNHWGYAPVAGVVGLLLCGLMDSARA